MRLIPLCVLLTLSLCLNGAHCTESDLHFRIEPGTQQCFFERARAGQMMEILYQVLDGQHGDLDINFSLNNPKGERIVTDFKRASNSIILDLEDEGDYSLCLDNTYSLINSKLVFIYVLLEEKPLEKGSEEAEVSSVDEDGEHKEETPVLEWKGTLEDGEPYYIEVGDIADSLTRTLKHVVRARHLLDLYGATKARDGYRATQDTFVVDAWSALQILLMSLVGMLQVYMIKKLFDGSARTRYSGC